LTGYCIFTIYSKLYAVALLFKIKTWQQQPSKILVLGKPNSQIKISIGISYTTGFPIF